MISNYIVNKYNEIQDLPYNKEDPKAPRHQFYAVAMVERWRKEG
jgi:hypothetical protein